MRSQCEVGFVNATFMVVSSCSDEWVYETERKISPSHSEDCVSWFTALLKTSSPAAQATIKCYGALSPVLAHSHQDRGIE